MNVTNGLGPIAKLRACASAQLNAYRVCFEMNGDEAKKLASTSQLDAFGHVKRKSKEDARSKFS